MNKYLIMLTSDSHHLMNEPEYYFKGYIVIAESLEKANEQIEFLQRKFSLTFKVFLNNVYHLWTCKIKN